MSLTLRKRTFTQGQRVRIGFAGNRKIYTIDSVKVTIDESLDVAVIFTLTRPDEMSLIVTPDELYTMLG